MLDPEQNSTFNDHYLEVDYDLSDVMFVTTANTLRMPQPLLDRMEIIRIPGYTEDEKVEIAKRHLIPKQMKAHGLKKGEWSITDDALRDLIRYYTREAGVRNLEREIANLARKAIKEILMQQARRRSRSRRRNLEKFAGVRRFRYGEVEETDLVGVTTGLAWTEVGGEMLSIEAVTLPGKGKVTATGKLGDVMQRVGAGGGELRQVARDRLRHQADDLRASKDIHVHVPEGATPKDGPSAGVAMVTSIVSVLTGIPVRRDVAMTGEITLARPRAADRRPQGEAAGGVARRAQDRAHPQGEREGSRRDSRQREAAASTIIPVATVDEVLHHALVRDAGADRVDRGGRPRRSIPPKRRGDGPHRHRHALNALSSDDDAPSTRNRVAALIVFVIDRRVAIDARESRALDLPPAGIATRRIPNSIREGGRP